MEAVAFNPVLVMEKVQNGSFLEQNIIKWINEVKSRGSTASVSLTPTELPSRSRTSWDTFELIKFRTAAQSFSGKYAYGTRRTVIGSPTESPSPDEEYKETRVDSKIENEIKKYISENSREEV